MPIDDLPPDDQPPTAWRRPVSDVEAASALPQPSLDDPVTVGTLFCHALEDPRKYQTALRQLTTPESHQAWGGFEDAARFLENIGDIGFGTKAMLAVGAPDVAYVKVLSGVKESYQVIDEQPVAAAAVVTLVWRPERHQWLVHSLGDYVKPADLPRTGSR